MKAVGLCCYLTHILKEMDSYHSQDDLRVIRSQLTDSHTEPLSVIPSAPGIPKRLSINVTFCRILISIEAYKAQSILTFKTYLQGE